MDKQRYTVPTFPKLRFHSFHTGFIIKRSKSTSIIRQENDDCVFIQFVLLKIISEFAHIGVDIPTHCQVFDQSFFSHIFLSHIRLFE